MIEPDVWDWRFSFLCPHCRTWNNYHMQNGLVPERFTRFVNLGRKPDEIVAILKCEDCGKEAGCPIAHVPL